MVDLFKNKKGFTVMELLVIVLVVGIIVLVVLPRFSSIRENAVLKSAVDDVLSSVDKAKNETLSSLNSSEYGVHFQSDKVIIFKGTTFSSGASSNETISITSPATISTIALTTVPGGVSTSDIYFKRIYNVPSATGTITISTSSYSKIITISATGMTNSN